MSLNELHSFDAVTIGDDNSSSLPEFTGDRNDSNAMLDYMFLVLARSLNTAAAFKGGYLLSNILRTSGGAEYSRKTTDIDFSIMQSEQYEEIKKVLNQVAEEFLGKGLITGYKIKDEIAPTCSGGIDMALPAGGKIGVDVGLHDTSYGICDYTVSSEDIQGFTPERMLSDKLLAILSRKRFRRTKDLFDFYAITNVFDVDYRTLQDFVERKGTAEWENIPFSDVVLVEYKKAWDKLQLRDSVSGDELEKPDFGICLTRFNNFAFALKEGRSYEKWIAKDRQWK